MLCFQALNIPKYSVLGWSDGGTTSFIHAAKYPDSIIKLVAWGTNSFILPHELDWYNSKLYIIIINICGHFTHHHQVPN